MENTIVQGNELNDLETRGKTQSSHFELNAPFAMTERYGEYSPIKALEVVPKDRIRMQLPSDLRSYTLKAPMMQNLKMHQDIFIVPLECILPNSAEKIIVNPVKGDDVPENANTVVYGFKTKIKSKIESQSDYIAENINTFFDNGNDNGFTEKFLKLLLFMEMFYSPGSLLASMEYYMNPLFRNLEATGEDKHNFGLFFDTWISKLWTATGTSGYWLLSNGNDDYKVVKENPLDNEIDLRTALCIMRDGYSWELSVRGSNQDWTDFTTQNQEDKYKWEMNEAYDILTTYDENEPFNYGRLVSYQIICAHYYTNDKIDYIYTAELWRENLMSLLNHEFTQKTYNYNGINIIYDAAAGRNMDVVLEELSVDDNPLLDYFRLIFGFNRSLRYQDYFTGGRSNPLAVGDVNVNVDNAQVSVVDITKNIQKQRFLNAVNRVGSKISSYIKELFGIEPAPDYHNPFWQGHTTDVVGSPETENTGAAQYDYENTPMAVTSNFRSNSSTREFEIHVDRYGFLIAIKYYDIPRLYFRGADRHFFHANRFDMFNPYMQFQGDQPIYESEILSKTTNGLNSYFGYQGRNMEYKQAISRAAGGFIYNLPSYVFLADYTRNLGANGDEVISPNYIRSLQTELDRFYGSLNGYSLDSYFHFIVIYKTQISADRPMAYNPEILG